MHQNHHDCRGEELASRLNDEIERLDLASIFAAEYVTGRDRVLLRRFDAEHERDGAVEYPTCLPWSDRAIDDLRMFVRLKSTERLKEAPSTARRSPFTAHRL